MKRSESIKEIAAALAKAQGAMEAASKDRENDFFHSKYATMASVVEAIKKPLADNGIAYFQTPVTNDKDECGVETLLLHSSGEWMLADPFFVPVTKKDSQGFGSAITYCRRYSLSAVCGVAPDDDDDGEAARNAKPDAKSKPALDPKRPNTATQVAKDALDCMSPEEQDFIRTHVAEIKKLFPLGDMWGYVDKQHFDTEETLAIWSLLPSDIRSAVKSQKAIAEAKKQTAGAPA